MLRTLSDLQDYSIEAHDGRVGHVKDFYFEDDSWVIRYLIVHTGSWLAGREVLISPIALGQPNWTERLLPVSLTLQQIQNSPDIDTDQPVSRQQERAYFGYYGYPYYWGGLGMWGSGYYPGYLQAGFRENDADAEYRLTRAELARAEGVDPNLRSCRAVVGYHIAATDGEIGHVSSFLVDEKTWDIRYLIVNTSQWWLGHQVLVAPKWIRSLSWGAREVVVAMTRQAVKQSPPYDAVRRFDRAEETDLRQHYERICGWPVEASRKHDLPRL